MTRCIGRKAVRISSILVLVSALVATLAAAIVALPPAARSGEVGLGAAKTMVDGAVTAIVENGWPGALTAVPQDTWVRLEDDLYVFVMNTRGVIVFHPNQGAIGVNVSGAQDIDGYAYMRDLMKQLDQEGAAALVEYYWPRPSDGKMMLKRTFARRVGNLLVACGVYVEDI